MASIEGSTKARTAKPEVEMKMLAVVMMAMAMAMAMAMLEVVACGCRRGAGAGIEAQHPRSLEQSQQSLVRVGEVLTPIYRKRRLHLFLLLSSPPPFLLLFLLLLLERSSAAVRSQEPSRQRVPRRRCLSRLETSREGGRRTRSLLGPPLEASQTVAVALVFVFVFVFVFLLLLPLLLSLLFFPGQRGQRWKKKGRADEGKAREEC